jgi:hypothetical protein
MATFGSTVLFQPIGLAVLRTREVEVGHHLGFGQAKVLANARIAHVLERVAANAVVEEQPGTALQRGLIVQVRAR